MKRSPMVEDFVRESNRIEGIVREPTTAEKNAHVKFLGVRDVFVIDIEEFVALIAPGKPLRRKRGQNVRVGNHTPPPGGPAIEDALAAILIDASVGDRTPYEIHVAYETLHPFMDGNGRSGRVLWAWQMRHIGRDPFRLGFLHTFYYQALDASGRVRHRSGRATGPGANRMKALRALREWLRKGKA